MQLYFVTMVCGDDEATAYVLGEDFKDAVGKVMKKMDSGQVKDLQLCGDTADTDSSHLLIV